RRVSARAASSLFPLDNKPRPRAHQLLRLERPTGDQPAADVPRDRLGLAVDVRAGTRRRAGLALTDDRLEVGRVCEARQEHVGIGRLAGHGAQLTDQMPALELERIERVAPGALRLALVVPERVRVKVV